MKLRSKPAIAGVAALALASAGLLATASSASAYTGTPPWVAGDTFAKGSVIFYDASGNVVTGGSNVNTLTPWIGGSTAARTNAIKATLSIALPDHSNALPSTWYNAQVGGSVQFNPAPAGKPASIPTLPNPLATNAFGVSPTPIEDALSGGVRDNTAGYQNTFELRMQDSGTGVLSDGGKYWRTVIEYNPSTATAPFDGLAPGAWQVIYPAAAATPTTTTVTAAPPSGALTSTPVTFTANVSANGGGLVTFKVDGVQFGTVKTLPAGASGSSVASDPGTLGVSAAGHTITADFAPAAPPAGQAGYGPSTGTLTGYIVGQAPALNTTTNLTLSGLDVSNTVTQPGAVGGTAVVTDSNTLAVTSGTVAFSLDGSATPFATVAGPPFTFSLSSSGLTVGAHSIIASFTDGTKYNNSVSAAAPFTVAASTYASDQQFIQTKINPGTLVISTPYVSSNPLVLPPMALNAGATFYTTSATFNNIIVTDTRPGNLPYTLSAIASNLTTGAAGPNQTINAQNVGLTGITPVAQNLIPWSFLGGVAPGGSTAGQVVTGFDNTAAAAVAYNAAGSAGLGGVAPHPVIHANSGLGTLTVNGLMTINAPTSTLDGTYNGTVTFTIVGS